MRITLVWDYLNKNICLRDPKIKGRAVEIKVVYGF